MSFDLNELISNCKIALNSAKPQDSVATLLREWVAEPSFLLKIFGNSDQAGIEKLYVSDQLTIINVVWAPKMTIIPHNHNTWAVIGVYAGREDNIFWRRLKNNSHNMIEAAGAKSIGAGDVAALGKNLIHSVTNPTPSFTRAIHIYGGNFFEIERSEWDPLNLNEQPYNVEKNLKRFEDENTLLNLLKEYEYNDE